MLQTNTCTLYIIFSAGFYLKFNFFLGRCKHDKWANRRQCFIFKMAFMKKLSFEVGRALRETGQALDRAGLRAMGENLYKEKCKSRYIIYL